MIKNDRYKTTPVGQERLRLRLRCERGRMGCAVTCRIQWRVLS